MDTLELQNMRFYGYHGVFPEENKLGQPFYVDLKLELDLAPAGRSDDLALTISYPDIIDRTQAIVEGPPFKLIEALAENIAHTLLVHYTRINAATVRVTKPHPPVKADFAGVAVQIRRTRSEADPVSR